MLKTAASVEEGGTGTLAAEPQRPETNMKQGTAMTRFAYSTGSRPLDGYTIKRGVGAGGFGEVYFAVSDAGKEVALKRIQRNLDIELRGVSQCLNLKHPNLVAIYDIRYDDEGQAWVVMEYVRGECLKDVIDRNPNGLPTSDMLDWFRGIAAGVGCLHEHGIVHRDLKPGNIFLDEGVVKLGDYGLSKYISCSRRSGQTESVGTFHYMAPEIGRGVYGKEIDVYSLGIVLYELLTGRVPFDGETSHEIIMKHLTALPDVSSLPEKFRPIVERALFKDPVKRFRSVGEMLDAVEAAVGTALAARPFHAAYGASMRAGNSSPTQEVMYLGGSASAEGMQFGPVREIATAERIPERMARKPAGDEPIAVAVRDSVRQIVGWWNSPALNSTARILLALLFVFLFFTNAGWILPLAILLGTSYLVYFGVRAILLSFDEPSIPGPSHSPVRVAPQPTASPMASPMAGIPATVPVAHPVSAVACRAGASRKRRKWHDVAREQLGRKTIGERLLELTGAMLMSAPVVAVISFLVVIVAGYPIDGSTQTWIHFSWLALMSLLCTWMLLIPAKMWEGSEGDDVRRRFLNLLLGLAVGALGFELTNFLGIRLHGHELMDLPTAWTPPKGMFTPSGMPLLPSFLGYFAGMFLLVRWWRQADPLRARRFSLWSSLVTIFVAIIWQAFWPFPQPWCLAIPAATSVALQVSSTWLIPTERSQIRKSVEA